MINDTEIMCKICLKTLRYEAKVARYTTYKHKRKNISKIFCPTSFMKASSNILSHKQLNRKLKTFLESYTNRFLTPQHYGDNI